MHGAHPATAPQQGAVDWAIAADAAASAAVSGGFSAGPPTIIYFFVSPSA